MVAMNDHSSEALNLHVTVVTIGLVTTPFVILDLGGQKGQAPFKLYVLLS